LYGNFLNTKELQVVDGRESKGIGIANLRRRLELLYNHKYELKVNNEYDCYETSLTIDLS
jgi:sensor histidine kinase YesM